VKDNARTSKVKVIDEDDRSFSNNARDVFDSLFPRGLMVRIKNIYELTPL